MPEIRALRVGVLLGDNLVEERLFTGAAPITIGQSLRCRLSIPADGLPSEHVLFAHDQGRVLLRLTATMNGRLAQGGSTRTELREGAGDHGIWVVPLERGARGKLTIGDATILFQELAAPPIAPRPRLPASLRGTFADRIDRKLALIVGGSLVMHIAIGTWAWINDPEVTGMIAAASNPRYIPAPQPEFQHVTITLPDAPVPPDPSVPGVAKPVAPIQTPAPIVHRPRATSRPDRLPTEDDARRFAGLLTGNDEQRGGPTDMRDRLPGADLDQQIDDIRDRDLAIGTDRPGFRDQDRQGIGTQPDPISGGPGEITSVPVDRRPEPTGRIDLRPVPQPPTTTTLTVAIVLAKINGAYMPGLQRCYKKGLLGDASLGGKVNLAFTVGENGRVTEPTVRGLTSEVDSCIRGQMSTWRFPIPKDLDGDPTEESFALVLALQPA